MSTPALTPAQWKQLIGIPVGCLHPDIQTLFKKHYDVVVAWINGVDIEMKMGKEPTISWYGVRKDKITFAADTEYRLAPMVTISATLTVKQANALYRVMEENSFHTEGGQTARNSVMRSIETELKKIGH